MSAAAAEPRRLPSFVNAFTEYSEGRPSPEIFRKWAAISCIAGALERRVWVRTNGLDMFPNLYTVLVGPPGVGKTVAISQTEALWRAVPDLRVSPTSVSKASLIDSLVDAKRHIIRPAAVPPFYEYHALLTVAGELGVFLPAYDNEFMNTLTSLYDNISDYEERKRSKDLRLKIPYPQLNLLAGTTPSYLNSLMPEGAWDQGFTSRTLLIFSGERVIVDLFAENSGDARLWPDLVHDTKQIVKLFGKVSWEQDAANAMSAWHQAGGPPLPEHNKLLHYITRRTGHLLKLCIVASVSRGDDLVITLGDYQEALGWLIEAELYMGDIFKSMGSGGDSQAIEDTWYYVYTLFAKEGKKPISEHRIIHFLSQRVPAHSIARVLDTMVASNMLVVQSYGDKGRKMYAPIPKQMHNQ